MPRCRLCRAGLLKPSQGRRRPDPRFVPRPRKRASQLQPVLPDALRALGRDAIYFDYVTSVEEALGDADYLGKFDALLLYANHGRIEPHQWKNLKDYVEGGGGFVPVHCASWRFGNEPGFDKPVGGRFKSHQGAEFAAKIVKSIIPR